MTLEKSAKFYLEYYWNNWKLKREHLLLYKVPDAATFFPRVVEMNTVYSLHDSLFFLAILED